MRPPVLSLGVYAFCACALGAALAQNSGDAGQAQTVPVGQTYKNFMFPIYQNSMLKYSISATQATGITQNRADAIDVKIQAYDDGAVTTTITSPQADLYVSEEKMRTSHTVQIERSDMEATAQNCDFDFKTKKFLLRTNVKVTLKNFDPGTSLNGGAATAAPSSTGVKAPDVPTPSVTPPATPRALLNNDSLPESPAADSSTNSAPIPPTSPDSK